MDEHTDSGLLAKWCAGDRDAYALLVSRHYGLVEAACRRQAPSGAADDCAQAVFLILARKPSAAVRAPVLAAWLQRTAWFVCDHARRSARRRQLAEHNATMGVEEVDEAAPCEALNHLDGCLLKLPERQREAVTLHYLAGRTPDEVATILGITRNHTYQLISRGLAGLRVLLARRGVAMAQTGLISLLATEVQAAANSAPGAMLTSLAGTPSLEAHTHAHGAIKAMTMSTVTPLITAAGLLLVAGTLSLVLTAEPPPIAPAVLTPAEWLAAQPKPAFKAGHTLPRLTRYGWECVPLATGKPLAADWGYALEFTRGFIDLEAVARIDDPTSREAQAVALARAEPLRYQLSVCTTQTIPCTDAPPSSYTRDAAGVALSAPGKSADGTNWGGQNGPLISPEAPDTLWEMGGELRAAPLRALIARGVRIDNVTNGGESGLGIPGFAQDTWNQDPKIGAAISRSPWGPGSMADYASAKKAHSELIMAKITKAAVPGRTFFNYYAAGGGTVRNKDWGVDYWGPRWQHARGTSDYPSNEVYFPNSGFTDGLNVLTKALNAASLEIATGDTLSYNWLSGGWDDNVADIGRWTGFLKCYYTAGMIGGNTGHYGFFTQGEHEAPFPQGKPPVWLRQLIATSYTHALFSQLEDVLRNGDLLPGPARHAVSPDEPAYEFPTGDDTARVVVRKHRTQPLWLITAWAADGADRIVPIYVPELGQLSVEARIVGSVYTATLSKGMVTMIRHDNEGATYTAVAPGAPVVTAVNLAFPLPSKDRLLWYSADSGVTVDTAGKVSAWASQDPAAVTVRQTDAARRPVVIPKAMNGKPAIRFANTWLENLDLGAQGDRFIGPLTVYAVFTGAEGTICHSVVMGVVVNGNAWTTGQGFCIANNLDANTFVTDGIALKTSPYPAAASQLHKLIIGENDNPGGGFGFIGDLAEVLVYKGQSQLSQERVRLYLESKYKLRRNTTLVNGDFEFPVVKGFQIAPCPFAGHARGAQGWFFANQALLQSNGSTWSGATAPSGTQTAVLQGLDGRLGSISQMVHLAAGSYTMSLKTARYKGQIQPLKFSVDQIQIGSTITPTGDVFQSSTTSSFTLTEGLHLLRIEATDNSGDKSTLLDDVILNKAGTTNAVRPKN